MSLMAFGTGSVEIFCKSQPVTLRDFLYVPKLSFNLISLLYLFKKKITVSQTEDKFNLECNNKKLLKGKIINKLFHMTYTLPTTLLTTNNQLLWHKRLGHPGTHVLKQTGLPFKDATCSVCEINKSHKQPFNHQFNSAVKLLDFIHLDLTGPIAPAVVSSF
ncbi:hypothetical protein O181_079711 [Austropuccinia psidii MF-1]|uniref:Retrovirus-related Pol polyprotein from transposon TNT 1-94-like beta-barrel domain-containing protein n=1 Tax=Austropuccinia psidii MF-1 TaxID=1389203 RepID=A0A9Q3IE82_9BASI|nr:hypothetical protein [Austropuccinia psidii MF-1]